MQFANATYTFEAELHLYSNTESELSNGDPCDTICIGDFCKCDNQFTFCLRPFSSGSENTDIDDCTLGGSKTTMVFQNSDGSSFDEVSDLGNGVPNPVEYAGSSWPVSLYRNDLAN